VGNPTRDGRASVLSATCPACGSPADGTPRPDPDAAGVMTVSLICAAGHLSGMRWLGTDEEGTDA